MKKYPEMASSLPSVSVVIPTYKRAGLVGRAIESVQRQTALPKEIIVVNDGSPDNTRDVLARYGDAIVAINQANTGLSGARNTGVRAATSEWVAFLDDDDEYASDRLEIALQGVSAFPESSVHLSNIALISSDGSQEDIFTLRGYPHPQNERLERPLARGLRGGAFAQGIMVKKSLIEKVGLFRKTFYEDMDLFVRLVRDGIWIVDGRPSIRLIRQPGDDLNLSGLWRSKPIENYQALVRIHREASLLPYLTDRERRLVWSGIYTNLFELACAYAATGDSEKAKDAFRECLTLPLSRRNRFKVRAFQFTGLFGPAFAARYSRRNRNVRA